MKCPKCGNAHLSHPTRVYMGRDTDRVPEVFWQCQCGWEAPCLSPAVRAAFAAYERALRLWERGVPVCHPDAPPVIERARRARARAEGKRPEAAEGSDRA